ncbi:sugar phosphate isomerase/epimerase family protein [Fimbriimonas ginsengisoli]|uniref:Xylose isomerase n=1 Tax=Fimbriimonas ginsengisoli Gsoil 348 TaxID=661478 RepID=A0A068NRF3_FIMGI|nr:sugar phosphate isomerase/epimerase family protein [Fimbriimonas ginsengisoli]AIE85957.1 xylose isomerase [Fimbriimonas ginsengisoli Gsoil 348]
MLLKSINYWSFPGGLAGNLEPVEAAKMAKAAGFEAIELCVGDAGTALGVDATDAQVAEIRKQVEALGLTVPSVASGLYWSRALADADPAARAQAADDLRAMIRISAGLGAKTLLTIPGAVEVFFLPDRPVQPYDEVLRYATEGLRAVLPTAAEFKVRLGIENVWNRFLLSPTEMAAFIDGFQSEWIGAYFDVANVLAFGFPEQWLRILDKRVVGVHFKDFRRAVGTIEGFVDLLEGDVDWPAVTAALTEIGYQGPVAAEMIPGYRHFPEIRIANTSRAMDAILGR